MSIHFSGLHTDITTLLRALNLLLALFMEGRGIGRDCGGRQDGVWHGMWFVCWESVGEGEVDES